ncbi:hypothetical protein V2O64_00605 [Verrucomicrobiaceae bacterium 227]
MKLKIVGSLICSLGLGFAGGYLFRPVIEDAGQGESASRQQGSRGGARGSRAGQSSALGGDGPARVALETMDDDELRESLREIIKEKDWVKKEAAFLSMLAGADLPQVQRMYHLFEEFYAQGWDTNALHSRVKMREGMLLGEAGMDEMPAEPNGMPVYPMREKMRGWASADPMAGWKWLQSLEPGRAQEMMMSEWSEGVQNAEPALLESLFPDLPEHIQARLMGKIVSGTIHQEGLAGLPQWYERLSQNVSEEVKATAFQQAINHYGQSSEDWGAAVEFMKGATEPGDELFAKGLQQLVWRGAKWDPNGTLDLLAEYVPQNEHLAAGRHQYISETIKWASSESALVVGEWLDGNRDSVIYDDVATRYVLQVRALDVAAAREWAESIKDSEVRTRLLDGLQE